VIALNEIKSVYFIGIGGIGMSALALYCKQRGMTVSGYDKTPSDITERLQRDGIAVTFDEAENKAPKDVGLVVYTPAVPHEHPQLMYYLYHGYNVVKRADLLQSVTDHVKTIAIAGTHGKTTTSTMVAHILEHSGFGCTAFLGGVSVNYDTNYWSSNTEVIVTEADEYDRSFLKLSPDIAVVTSVDPDHLDIYGTHEAIIDAYNEFTEKIKDNGTLVHKHHLPVRSTKPLVTYAVDNDQADAYAANLLLSKGTFKFDFIHGDKTIENVHLPVPGRHNVENAVAAMTVASLLGIQPDKIKSAVESFRGVKRRFEIIFDNSNVTYVDDYAHHPQEIEAFLKALKTFRPDQRITCIFQPHLYTRTRDFAGGFARTLALADKVVLMPIYPAREEPIQGVTSEMIAKLMQSGNPEVLEPKEILSYIESHNSDVICTVGAGDVDRLINPIKEILSRSTPRRNA